MAATAPATAAALPQSHGNGWSLRPISLPSVAVSYFSPKIAPICLECSCSGMQLGRNPKARIGGLRGLTSVSVANSSDAEAAPKDSERWLLEPVGDGDTRHIGFRVPMPSAFEIVSDVVTVGRLPEKVDTVIAVATVSGIHARLEKRDGLLLVTDLDSTNGTFIDEIRLRPGRVYSAPPGSRITFGDTHLAMFLVSKLQEEKAEAESSVAEVESAVSTFKD
ncbi:SMAD/FHA domain-containing protein [Wolffia australiana]